MAFVIPPEIQTTITQAVTWLWGKYGQPLAEKAAKRTVDEVKWKFGIEKYYTSLFERVGFVRILGRKDSEPLENIFTHVNVLDKLSAEQRYGVHKLMAEFSPRDFERLERVTCIPGDDAVLKFPKLFILGKPGAGKTTFLQHTALRAIKHEIKRVPLFVTLKELSDSGMEIVPFMTHQLSVHRFPKPEQFLARLLEKGDGLVLFDGLDEVNLADNKRAEMIRQINDFVYRYSDCPTLMTCRVAATDYSFTQFEYVEMADFDAVQMGEYIDLWFVGDAEKRKICRRALLEDEANKAVRELAQVPLLLALLCLVFEERNEIPPERHEIYEEAMRALLSKWDASRNISRDTVYQQLTLGRKQKMLAMIAAKTFEKGDYFLKEREVVRLLGEYLQGVPGLEEPDAEKVLQTLEAQHGIFVERALGIHSFSHLTLQEYFTARYIVDNEHRGAVTRLMQHVGDDRWREVFLLVAGMLEDATEFGEQYMAAAHKLIGEDTQLIHFIECGVEKGAVAQAGYKIAASRAFFHYRTRALALDDVNLKLADLTLGYLDEWKTVLKNLDDFDATPNNPEALAHALSIFDRARSLARALARTLDHFLDNDIILHDYSHTLEGIVSVDEGTLGATLDTHTLNASLILLIYARNFDRYSVLKIAERRQLSEMAGTLRTMMLPEIGQEHDVQLAYAKNLAAILEKYQDQWDPYHLMAVTEDEALLWKDISKKQVVMWTFYLEANLLLARCLQVAYVPNRQALEDKILLPPESW